jgi:hypothetical protein
MRASFPVKHFSKCEPSAPEVSCSSTKRDPKKRGCGLFSEQDRFDGGCLPAVRCDWVDAAYFREPSVSSGAAVMVTKSMSDIGISQQLLSNALQQ